MDTRKVKALIETISVGSINKAAEQLGYTQSGLTYVIQSLEDELGIVLIKRSHKGIKLTSTGRKVLPYLEKMIQNENRVFSEIITMDAMSSEKHIIRIGVYASSLVYWISDEIQRFITKYPNVKFDIRVGVQLQTYWIDENIIDIAIIEKELAEGRQWQFLIEDEFCVVVPKSSDLALRKGISLEDLQGERMIFPTLNDKNRVLAEIRKRDIHFEQKIIVRTEDGSVLHNMVARGLGITFMSGQYITECPEENCMIPFLPGIKRELGFIVSETGFKNEYLETFVGFLKRSAAMNKKHNE